MSERAASFAEHARRYSELGWALVRLEGKVPQGRRWQSQQPDPDPEHAAGAWAEWGQRWNMGVVLGPSGTAVAEYDTPEGGRKLLELLGGSPPLTPTCRTGSDRLHFYFRPPAGFDKTARDGIELRLGGHQCVLPPSEHPGTGKPYAWLSGREPWALPLAEVPPALLEYLGETRSNGAAEPLPEIIPIGAIDTTLASLAGSMRRRGASEQAIYAALLEELVHCEPGHTHTEADCRRIARSVARYEPALPEHSRDEAAPSAPGTQSDEPAGPAEPFRGRSQAEVLRLDLPEERELITGLIPIGVPGTIAGLPETHKSFIAQKTVVVLARGEGEVLGCPVAVEGPVPVGYFWQDDSEREEVERVQLYEQIHASPPDLPLRWFLNEGLELPRDLERLRLTIERYGLRLVVLDSFYNVALVDLKDREAGQVISALKAQVCDPTGCKVLVVDHMPWATDTNRQRLRGYGDVFKGAAFRFGIYVHAENKKLWVEARGNNIRGFKRSPAYWDEEALELRLADTEPERSDTEIEDEIVVLLSDGQARSTSAVRKAVTGRAVRVDAALERLKERDEVIDQNRSGGTWSDEVGKPRYWKALGCADQTPSLLDGTTSDEEGGGSMEETTSSTPSHPRRGDEVVRDGVRRT